MSGNIANDIVANLKGFLTSSSSLVGAMAKMPAVLTDLTGTRYGHFLTRQPSRKPNDLPSSGACCVRSTLARDSMILRALTWSILSKKKACTASPFTISPAPNPTPMAFK